MEESLNLLLQEDSQGHQDVREYSPLTLAYMGDSVYELLVRTRVVEQGNAQVNKLNKKASQLAKAGTQSAIVEKLQDIFTEEELSVYRRGRNAHSYTKAKNATTADYRRATGFEAVFGYLYLKGDILRLRFLFEQSMMILDEEENEKG